VRHGLDPAATDSRTSFVGVLRDARELLRAIRRDRPLAG
jgi:hypothetical protein